MKNTGIMYRPPFESSSLLLEVTTGCSHNRCAFCTMYRGVRFRAVPMDAIESDLAEARRFRPNTERVFLENGDPFALHADKLEKIAWKIHEYLPKVKTIAMYASIQNIQGKSDEELKRLRSLGLNDLNIGVESGLDEALAMMNKGYTGAQALHALCRLKNAGFDFGANVIFGCAGAAKWRENAEATAALLNETRPTLIFTGTIHADKGCPLYDDLQSGAFEECTVGEYLDEEECFLSRLCLDNCLFFGLHPSNVAQMYGYLNRDRKKLLAELTRHRKRLADRLYQKPRRGSKGAIINGQWEE